MVICDYIVAVVISRRILVGSEKMKLGQQPNILLHHSSFPPIPAASLTCLLLFLSQNRRPPLLSRSCPTILRTPAPALRWNVYDESVLSLE
ncbi:hypothetical protein M9H77_01435 [Catharanthus roseus]|uniref:Uncharacterized protein n=1 Tax=Catharanthus roseus TaxID=4058 RepID=A0ACC0C5Z0_CATRO|nr:hypothetical protein M9H77_01435 [Catharanthus roseus]